MPMIGLGTHGISDKHAVYNVIENGMASGYRHIDTAHLYKNEEFVGEKLREIFKRKDKFRLKRSDVFVTTKLWNTRHSRFQVIEGLIESNRKLNIDYIDLFLVHFPMGWQEGGKDIPLDANGLTIDTNISVVDTWKGMEDALRMGMVRSIGVSNFNVDQLTRLEVFAKVRPVVNLLEINPYLTEDCLVRFCQKSGIQVAAYSPLSRGNQTLLHEPVLIKMALKHHKTVPQIIFRWLIQRGIAVISTTIDSHRMHEYMDIFDFKLSESEMKKISRLNKNWRKTDVQYSRFNAEYPFRKMCYD
ncbi:aldose reductase C-like [Oppia nitens]|uniref:aldose reductase C-like n=1 Tax=Oppia nitens TaxID=1686743 RepID=UPI0023DC8722|nr:aldose reductase C-like [Oppia nitens]